MTSIGGSWRTSCFSSRLKQKPYCVARGCNATRWTSLVKWKLRALLWNSVTLSSCLISSSIQPSVRITTLPNRCEAATTTSVTAHSSKMEYTMMVALVHWDHRTNSCLAVFTRLSSWLTMRFPLVLQRSGMTCLLTAALQLVWIVLNITLKANFSPAHMLLTPSNSRLSRLWFHFFAWTNWHAINSNCICIVL